MSCYYYDEDKNDVHNNNNRAHHHHNQTSAEASFAAMVPVVGMPLYQTIQAYRFFRNYQTQIVQMGSGLGIAAFVSFYGEKLYRRLSNTIHIEMHDNLQKKHYNHHTTTTDHNNVHKKTNTSHHTNNDDIGLQIKTNNSESLKISEKVLMAGVITIVLNWLQYRGASKMRAYMLRIDRHETKQFSDSDTRRLQTWKRFNNKASHPDDDSHNNNDDYDVDDDDIITTIGGGVGNSTKKDMFLYNLYKPHSYYNNKDKDVPSGDDQWSIMRAIFNMLVGVSIQFSNNKTKQNDNDPTQFLITALKGVGFFEILCQSLHLYGWSPLNATLLAIQRSL